VLAAQANEQLVNAVTKYAKEARLRQGDPDSVRAPAVDVLKNSLTISAPPDPKGSEELTRIVALMRAHTAAGSIVRTGSAASA
jgi:hypothetical protein